MTDFINNRLTKIVGTSVNYKGKDHFIERYKSISTNRICVFTHVETLTFFESEIETFLDSITEPKDKDFRTKELVSPVSKQLAGFVPSAENIEMKASLMEMMARVKADANAIPQAREVCSIVNAMAKIQKYEIEIIKLTVKKE